MYDTIIIGAGLSGLSAGIRLAYYGKRVRIFESHALPGGLNSYYSRGTECIDVGLHAMTNYADESQRSAPLNKILRQLRLKRDTLQLCPQSYSVIDFPGAKLRFSNGIDSLRQAIGKVFPSDTTGFDAFLDELTSFDTSVQHNYKTAREALNAHIHSPQLREMLLCPVMLYGNPTPNDMDFSQYSIMFRSVLMEGMARPFGGMRPMISLLAERFKELGGELSLHNGIASMAVENGHVASVTDSQGNIHTAHTYLSNAGYAETLQLCQGTATMKPTEMQSGKMGFIETMFRLDCTPAELGIDASIIFRSTASDFFYGIPDGPIDTRSQILCMPGNYIGCNKIPAAKTLKFTLLASAEWWFAQTPENYTLAKADVAKQAKALLCDAFPQLEGHILSYEMFTPCTIKRFTGHTNGAIYGSPCKHNDGTTPLDNLHITGTDQGLLGIVGSLMSGIVVANKQLK